MAPATETGTDDDLINEVGDLVAGIVHTLLMTDLARAGTCGCAGCRADAQQATAWVARLTYPRRSTSLWPVPCAS